jgi:hypothetical protein
MMLRLLVIAGAAGAIVFAPAARAKRTQVTPYLEVDQSVFSDLNSGGGTFAYTTVAAGIDASISTPRTEGQISYRYEHRFGWGGDSGNGDTHSGLARGQYTLVPNLLRIEAGGLATRTRNDLPGVGANPVVGNADNVSQLYSVYAGPALATKVGDFDVGAAYRFGYTKLDTHIRNGPAGQRNLGGFDASTDHVASAKVGIRVGVLPIAWNVSAGYEREDQHVLDQRFESGFVRADVTVPVSPTFAAVGGAGYEKIKTSSRNPLVDGSGNLVFNGNGNLVTDPASPRLLDYDQSGFIWDVGILWRPSKRTSLEARVGRRYGSMTYTGSFSYQPSDDMAFQVNIYDGVQTFGRQLNASLSSLPTQFTLQRNPFGGSIGGCVFGVDGGGAGGCLNTVLQSIASGTYRSRGINAVWRYGRGPWVTGLGLGYAERTFLASRGVLLAVNGTKDRGYYAQANLERRLTSHSGIDGTVYVDWYQPGLLGAQDVLGTGATGSYYHNFSNRLTGTAALGLYSTRVEDFDSTLTGLAQVGARYQF